MTQVAQNNLQSEEGKRITILDVGCAAGEFPYFLKSEFPEAVISAFDLRADLIEKAKTKVAGVNFFVGDVLDSKAVVDENNFYDLIFCSGVLSIFDDFEPILENLLGWTGKSGLVVLHGLFNDFPVDVNVKYKLSENYDSPEIESDWNIFSKQSVSRYLDRFPQKLKYSFINFKIDVELPRQTDILRSWTFEKGPGELGLTNGLGFIQPHSILVIQKS